LGSSCLAFALCIRRSPPLFLKSTIYFLIASIVRRTFGCFLFFKIILILFKFSFSWNCFLSSSNCLSREFFFQLFIFQLVFGGMRRKSRRNTWHFPYKIQKELKQHNSYKSTELENVSYALQINRTSFLDYIRYDQRSITWTKEPNQIGTKRRDYW